MATPIINTLASRHIVLDGALGTQLEELIPPENPLSVKGLPLWSTKVLIEQPQLITNIHRSYVDAGATMLITSLYQASLHTLEEHCNMDLAQARQVWHASVQCALDSIESCDHKVYIAGSVGPYGAYLANGAEYSGAYGDIAQAELVAYHKDMVEFFVSHHQVDCLAFETVPNITEVRAIIELVGEVFSKCGPKEFYVTLSCKSGSVLADGTPLETVVEELEKVRDLDIGRFFVGTGCNCVPFEHVSDFINTVNGVTTRNNTPPLTLIVYPNFGFGNDMSDVSQYSFQKKSEKWALAVQEWVEHDNVRIIGGCCSTGPTEVRDIRQVVNRCEH